MKGYLMQLQPFSVNDGDGIRTTIFFAGCPLHCKWCSNPEGITQQPKIGFYEKLCIGCGECASVCPQGIGIALNQPENRKKCIACGACVAVCPKQARKNMVVQKSVEEVIAEVEKHSLFYRQSGGGITFSGGEATLQKQFLDELSSQLYDLGYSLDIETSGYFNFDEMLTILKRMDLIFMDLKHMNTIQHKKFTGVYNEKILENMKRLKETGAKIVIRIPVIEGVNAYEENIFESGEFVKKYLPNARMELLPYHKFGFGKYQALSLDLPQSDFQTPTKQKMEYLKSILTKMDIQLADFT